jgi:hypothetical protein
MRKIILLLVVTVLSKAIVAEKDNRPAAPQNIVSNFSIKYPGVQVKQWQAAKGPSKGMYVAKFTQDGKKSLAYYSSTGDWIKTERKIKWTWNLPAAVKAGWEKTEYVRWYVETMKEVETPGQHVYVMHVNNGPTLGAEHAQFQEGYLLYFSGAGELIQKEKCD